MLNQPRLLRIGTSIAIALLFSLGSVQLPLAFAADPPPPVPVPAPTPEGTGDSQYLTPDQIAALNQAIEFAKRTGSGASCITYFYKAVRTGQIPSPIPPDCSDVITAIKTGVGWPAPYGPQPSDVTPAPVPTPSK
jgi:hypothetical protein